MDGHTQRQLSEPSNASPVGSDSNPSRREFLDIGCGWNAIFEAASKPTTKWEEHGYSQVSVKCVIAFVWFASFYNSCTWYLYSR